MSAHTVTNAKKKNRSEHTKRISKYEGYTIENIRLPYGREDSGDSEYDPQKNVASVYMGPEGVDCDLSLDHVATAMDYEFLRTYTIKAYIFDGVCYGLRISTDLYHYELWGVLRKQMRRYLSFFRLPIREPNKA